MLRIAFVLAALALIACGSAANAQSATPVAGVCSVEPRDDEEVRLLAGLAATPPAEPSFGSVRMPAGEPVAAATTDLLLATLNEADACAGARDLLRFLALYTDSFIVKSILASEPAGVVPGSEPPGQEN